MELLAAHDKAKQKAAAAAANDATAQQDWTIAAQGVLTGAGASSAAEQKESSCPDGNINSSSSSRDLGGSGSSDPSAAAVAATAVAASCSLIDLSSKVEVAPVVIPPGMPLAFIYHIMQEQGLNYVPVIRHHGPLEGMVSRSVLVLVACVPVQPVIIMLKGLPGLRCLTPLDAVAAARPQQACCCAKQWYNRVSAHTRTPQRACVCVLCVSRAACPPACRAAIVSVQNERLDRFHVKDSMQQAAQDIQGGRILQVCCVCSCVCIWGGWNERNTACSSMRDTASTAMMS